MKGVHQHIHVYLLAHTQAPTPARVFVVRMAVCLYIHLGKAHLKDADQHSSHTRLFVRLVLI